MVRTSTSVPARNICNVTGVANAINDRKWARDPKRGNSRVVSATCEIALDVFRRSWKARVAVRWSWMGGLVSAKAPPCHPHQNSDQTAIARGHRPVISSQIAEVFHQGRVGRPPQGLGCARGTQSLRRLSDDLMKASGRGLGKPSTVPPLNVGLIRLQSSASSVPIAVSCIVA
jgi:hypothetical protein